ncbi:MAG: CYTH and CHAD domain-containing protein [Anaerolineae bacterium]
MKEQELRYRVPGCALAGLRKLSALGFYTLQKIAMLHITDRYLDTANSILKQAGYALRFRSGDDGWLVTLKSDLESKGAVTSRTEDEIRLSKFRINPGRWPASKLQQLILGTLHDSALETVAQVRQKRERWLVQRGAETVAELSLDRVDCNSPTIRLYLLECELLGAGTRADLDLIDILLNRRFVLTPEYRTKLELATISQPLGDVADTELPARTLDELKVRYAIDPVLSAAELQLAERIIGKLLPKDEVTPDAAAMLQAVIALRTSLNRLDPGCFNLGTHQLTRQPIKGSPEGTQYAVAKTAILSLADDSEIPGVGILPESVQAQAHRLVAISQLAAALIPRGNHSLTLEQISCKLKATRLTISGSDAPAAVKRLAQLEPGITRYLGPRLDVSIRDLNAQIPATSIEPRNVDIKNAGITYLATLTERFEAYAQAALEGHDPEAVHDLRVTSRRLRSALRLLAPVLPTNEANICLGLLKTCTDRLGEVRDAEVMLGLLSDYQAAPREEYSDISAIVGEWQELYNHARDSLIAYLRGDDHCQLEKALSELVSTARSASEAVLAEGQPAIFISGQVQKLERKIRTFKRKLNDTPLGELHLLRIYFKRLRYTLESASEVYAIDYRDVLELLADIQTELGTMHDYAVMLGYIAQRDKSTVFSLADMSSYCVEKLSSAYLTFIQFWYRYSSPQFHHALEELV